MAPRTCNPRHSVVWRSALLAAALMAVPSTPTIIDAQAPARAAPLWMRAVAATRFSDLAELTPANVDGLMPLVSQTRAVALQDRGLAHGEPAPGLHLQAGSSAGVDLRLRRFVEERASHMRLTAHESARLRPIGGSPGCIVSYVVGTPGAGDSAPAQDALALRELRAWDPIERRVLWSVREALPISSSTLVTAGGLVFYGTTDGWLKALDARTGRLLWKHRVDGRRPAEPLSYLGTDGHQYIAVRSLPRDPDVGSETLRVFALAH